MPVVLRSILIIAILFFANTRLFGQFSLYNLLEYQHGNIPNLEPDDRNAVYNQLNLAYRYKSLRASTRLETFFTDDVTGGEYVIPTQWNVNYRKKGLALNAGNFYETIGRGLLLRGYEIKNSVYEDLGYRVKQGFYRDIYGASGSYQHSLFSVKAIHGKVLNNLLPPSSDEKRTDLVTAAEAKFNLWQQSIGAIYMENINPTEFTQFAGVLLEGVIGNNISYYGEFGQQTNRGQHFFETNHEAAYGAYATVDYSLPGFGISLEVKDYHNFFLGSGLNDPPTLVKEQSYKTLNRSIHFSDLNDEAGIQVEVFFKPSKNHLFTFNYAKAVSDIYFTYRFQEIFGEWSYDLSDYSNLKIFADVAYDDIQLDKSRLATGIYYNFPLCENWNLGIETEYQHIERGFNSLTAITNTYAGLVFNFKSIFTGSLVWEFSNDESVTDNPYTEKIEKIKHFPGINLQYKPSYKNTITLFAGERRGGPSCTSGICYEVLDFRGVEIRWTTRL